MNCNLNFAPPVWGAIATRNLSRKSHTIVRPTVPTTTCLKQNRALRFLGAERRRAGGAIAPRPLWQQLEQSVDRGNGSRQFINRRAINSTPWRSTTTVHALSPTRQNPATQLPSVSKRPLRAAFQTPADSDRGGFGQAAHLIRAALQGPLET